MAIQPATRLGPYEILSAIGAGRMGEVYKAGDTLLERIVAIKVLPHHLADRPELRERFERAASTIASLNHRHICTLYDVGHQDGIERTGWGGTDTNQRGTELDRKVEAPRAHRR